MKIEFTALGIKRFCDSYLPELLTEDQGGYTTQKNTKLIKVWTRSRGIDECPEIPISRCDHYFPEIDDPKLLVSALKDFRVEWDGSNYSLLETLKEHTSPNFTVQRQVTHGRLGTSGREFIDKCILFSV